MFKKLGIILLVTVLLTFNLPLATVQGHHDPSVIDTDGDLNADSADPAPNDPNIGGVYPGAVITYNVLLAGDLDASGMAGSVITLAADNITFDGGDHKIISGPSASPTVEIAGVQGAILRNLDVSGLATGTGIELRAGSGGIWNDNITITNVNASGRRWGINGSHTKNSKIMENTARDTLTAGISLVAGHDNEILNNDVSGSIGDVNWGIFLDGSNNLIYGNNASNHPFGHGAAIHVTGTANTIQKNNLTTSGVALALSGTANKWRNFTDPTLENDFRGSTDTLLLSGYHDEVISDWDISAQAMGPSSVPGGGIRFIGLNNNITITRVNASGRRWGISSYASGPNTNIRIENNTLKDTVTAGIYIFALRDSFIINNDVSGAIGDVNWGIYVEGGNNNLIGGNIVLNHPTEHGAAIQLAYNSGNTVQGNIITNSGIGLRLQPYSHNNVIEKNEIANNSKGLFLSASTGNTIYHNNIIGNVLQALDSNPAANNWYHPTLNGGEGNYWSDYMGVDIGGGSGKHAIAGDLIGDTLIPHPGPDFDFYPYVIPFGWLNQPPVAEAGGPYVGSEGSPLNFDGTGSYDPDGTIVSYKWDLDNDGFDDAIGTSPSYTWADDYSGTVGLKVTDDKGLADTDTAQVTVNNVNPAVNIDSVIQPNPIFILPHHNLTFTGSFTDPGWLDTHTASWDFGDGTIIPNAPLTEENVYPDSTGASTVTYVYLAPGTYIVTLTITDDDGGVGKATVSVKVLSALESVAAINAYIQALPDAAFANNPDQRKNAFAQKLAEVQTLIDAGLYGDAINKLQNDILMKVDGFIDNKPDLDWVVDELAQRDLYYAILVLVSHLQGL